jgi:hypothetical protein
VNFNSEEVMTGSRTNVDLQESVFPDINKSIGVVNVN